MSQKFEGKESSSLTVVVAAKYSLENMESLHSWIPKALRSGFAVRVAIDCPDLRYDIEVLDNLRNQDIEILKVGNFGGPGKSRNMLLGDFKSDYVVFWDADDIPDVPGVSKILDSHYGDKRRFIVGQWQQRQFGTIKYLSQDSSLSKIAFSPGNWRILYPTSNIEGKRFPEIWMGEDQVFLFQSGFFRSTPIWSSQRIYTYKTGIEGQLTGQDIHIKDLQVAVRLIKNLMKNCEKSEVTTGNIIMMKLLFTYWRREANSTLRQKLLFMKVIFEKPRFTARIIFAMVTCFRFSILRKNF